MLRAILLRPSYASYGCGKLSLRPHPCELPNKRVFLHQRGAASRPFPPAHHAVCSRHQGSRHSNQIIRLLTAMLAGRFPGLDGGPGGPGEQRVRGGQLAGGGQQEGVLPSQGSPSQSVGLDNCVVYRLRRLPGAQSTRRPPPV